MDDGPIREEETWFKKFMKLGKKICNRPVKKEDHFVRNYEIGKSQEEFRENLWMLREAARASGISANDFREAVNLYNNRKIKMKDSDYWYYRDDDL